MEAIRTISHVTNNSLTLHGLEAFNGKTVEVIIRPVLEEEIKQEEDPITSARGCLKGLGLTSKLYMQSKQAENGHVNPLIR